MFPLRCLVVSLLAFASGHASAADHPNVLFILTEDQGTQLSFVGTAGLSTPNMDRIAKDGVYFNRAFVNNPVCSPSKANIYTGTYCHFNGLRGVTVNWHGPADEMPRAIANHPLTKRNRIRDDLPTLVKLLKDAGYSSAITTKLHVQPVSKFPYDRFIKGGPTYESVREHFVRAGDEGVPVFYFACISDLIGHFATATRWISASTRRRSNRRRFFRTPAERTGPNTWGTASRPIASWARFCVAWKTPARKNHRGLGPWPRLHRGKLSSTISESAFRCHQWSDNSSGSEDRRPGIKGRLDNATGPVRIAAPDTRSSTRPSFIPFLRDEAENTGNNYIFSELDHGTRIRDDGEGMQERCVYDGRWKLIYRENRTEPRQVNADLKFFRHPEPNGPYQGNRVYGEIADRRDEFPEAFRYLALTDNGELMPGEPLPMFELYDLVADHWELTNLAGDRTTSRRLSVFSRNCNDGLSGPTTSIPF